MAAVDPTRSVPSSHRLTVLAATPTRRPNSTCDSPSFFRAARTSPRVILWQAYLYVT